MSSHQHLTENAIVKEVNHEKLQQNVNALPVVTVRDLTRTYRLGQSDVRALRGISLDVYPGEFVAVTGPSGSGKSTFMNIIGCMDRPTGGEYRLKSVLVSTLRPDQLAIVRSRHIGFIFQNFNLLPRESALANVMLPLVYQGLPQYVQRAAIARALVSQPSLLLADEPTGNLDSETSQEILMLLQALNEQGITIIVVTHSAEVAGTAKRRVAFKDGLVVQDEGAASSGPLSLPRSGGVLRTAQREEPKTPGTSQEAERKSSDE